MAEGIQLDGVRVAKARQNLPGFNGRTYLRQSEFAEVIGIHPVTMNRIENGQAKVSLETAEKLCRALGVSREWLQGEPERIDEFELARAKMTNALAEFSDAVDLLQRAARAAGQTDSKPVEVLA
jgi:transcriptional regulator with XRE-family HTH domain